MFRKLGLIQPRQLSVRAHRARARAGGPSSVRLRTAIFWRVAVSLWTGSISFLPIFFVSVVVLFLDIPWGLDALAGGASNDYLSTMWQVEAAAVALSVAVIALAFETFFPERERLALGAPARETGLLPVLYLGVTNLVVTGLVLLGYGPSGAWPATWAVGLAALEALLLLVLFARAIRFIDPASLRKRRVRFTQLTVQEDVDATIHERLALAILRDRVSELGVDLQLFMRRPPPAGSFVVKAASHGVVQDIDLWKLEELVKRMPTPPVLYVHIAQRVAPESFLLALSAHPGRLTRWIARRVVKVAE